MTTTTTDVTAPYKCNVSDSDRLSRFLSNHAGLKHARLDETRYSLPIPHRSMVNLSHIGWAMKEAHSSFQGCGYLMMVFTVEDRVDTTVAIGTNVFIGKKYMETCCLPIMTHCIRLEPDRTA